jgi:CheY-like chemotaxis protein
MKSSSHRDSRRHAGNGVMADPLAGGEWDSMFRHDAILSADPAPAASAGVITINKARKRVLIADDDDLVRGSLAAVLESEGYIPDEAENGVELISRVMARMPDVVLLDLNMPRCDGWTAFKKLEQVAPLLTVIVITARPNQYMHAVQLGVDAFMEKPLNIPVLMRAIKRFAWEDEIRHIRRITSPDFVTRLLDTDYP